MRKGWICETDVKMSRRVVIDERRQVRGEWDQLDREASCYKGAGREEVRATH